LNNIVFRDILGAARKKALNYFVLNFVRLTYAFIRTTSYATVLTAVELPS